MARRSTAQPVLPFGELTQQARRVEGSEVARLERALGWEQILRAAFADPDRNSGFLALAEEAVRAQPGDGQILLLAATAALLDAGSGARAGVSEALLQALRCDRRLPPAACLGACAGKQARRGAFGTGSPRAHGRFNAHARFPRRLRASGWLPGQYNRIFDRDKAGRRKHAPRPDATLGCGRRQGCRHGQAGRTAGQDSADCRSRTAGARRTRPGAAPAAADRRSMFRSAAELDLAPLHGRLAEAAGTAMAAGTVCASALPISASRKASTSCSACRICSGIETFWYQVETVRKVLKQFRGRVLLADEVGLGKTIEAGMVLKEYLLRGMVESVLVLTPASLVGQWREELETKFDIACATTHDALLRSDPARFWAQKRVIASLALARRSEHAAHIARPQLRSRHRRRGPSPARPREPELPAGGRAQQALPAAAVGDAGAERPHRALQPADPAQARHLQDAEGVPRRLHDAGQAAPAGQSRAPARADARRHGAQHARGGRAEAAAPSRRDDPGRTAPRASGPPTSELAAAARRLAADGEPTSAGAAASARRRRIVAGRRRRRGAALRPAATSMPAWHALAQSWASVGAGGKEAALLDLLRRNPDEKKLVFVHYRETLEHLAGAAGARRASPSRASRAA